MGFKMFISDKPTNITLFQVRMVCLKVNKPKLNPLEKNIEIPKNQIYKPKKSLKIREIQGGAPQWC